jgi:xylulokinase
VTSRRGSALLLGIDVGTSGCKVAAYDLDGVRRAQASRPYPLLTPGPGRVEQNPDQWWQAAILATREVTARVDPARIVGVGASGQSWSVVPISDDGEVLAHSPIWMDCSTDAISRELATRIGTPRLLSVSGNPLQPSYSTTKIIRLRREHPDLYQRTRVFLQSNGFIGWQLTGVASLDRCQAYGLHCFDTTTGQYDARLADDLGLDLDKQPDLVDCHHVIGQVSDQAAGLTGLRAGTPVVAGGLDAACAAFGAGVWQPGQVQEQGGQAGGMSVVTNRPTVDQRLILSRHVVPGLWLTQGGTVAGGASLQWVYDQLGHPQMSFEDIDREAAAIQAGSDGTWYLPYLAGERSPLWDPAACGVFYGLRLTTSRAAMFRAVMEGVAYSLLDNLTVAEQAGADARQLRATGGAAASRLWTQIKADVTGRIIHVPAATQPSTLGAALLAGIGVGAYRGFSDAAAITGQISRTHIPGEDQPVYVEGFEVYRQLYRALKPLMAITHGPDRPSGHARPATPAIPSSTPSTQAAPDPMTHTTPTASTPSLTPTSRASVAPHPPTSDRRPSC